ncbi:MAG: hypothetical protein K6E46_02565 [Lachnospiraceae bacterium]|nr:hypothetical protein [Lachnospiraceae bacterium]
MSSIDNKEKELILRIANEIAKQRKDSETSDSDTYFLKDEKLSEYKLGDLMEYSPDVPTDIEVLLQELWEKRKTPEMNQFIKVCTVAALKNRQVSKTSENAGVSAYVYEF